MGSKRILIAPLDWGLGHASRCVPIIKAVVRAGYEPVLTGSGQSFEWLKLEFPNHRHVTLPSYNITYPKNGNFVQHFGAQFLKMSRFIKEEHSLVKEIVKSEKIDAIISDNRYGIFHDSIPSAIISHQLKPAFGFFTPFLQPLTNRLLNRFEQVWIPDFQSGISLSGKLSDVPSGLKKPVVFLGPLSRFHSLPESDQYIYRYLAVLSGPEPLRTAFQNQVEDLLATTSGRHAIAGYKYLDSSRERSGNVDRFGVLNTKSLSELIEKSECIICRSGYSSIMDLCTLNRAAIIVPTPGQAEQEYLAKHHFSSDLFLVQEQSNLNFEKPDWGKKKKRMEKPSASGELVKVINDFVNG